MNDLDDALKYAAVPPPQCPGRGYLFDTPDEAAAANLPADMIVVCGRADHDMQGEHVGLAVIPHGSDVTRLVVQRWETLL